LGGKFLVFVLSHDLILQPLYDNQFLKARVSVEVLRLDLIHPFVGGNKWFKLNLNLKEAKKQNLKTIITFGGAYSNHIAATAAACKMEGLQAVGIIRGEESSALNPTLWEAKENGMKLHFVSREFYKQKESEDFKIYLEQEFGRHYLIPEGGNNNQGVMGCALILDPNWRHDYICCAVGTGATFAGLSLSAKPAQVTVGINVLKGENRSVMDAQMMLNKIHETKKFIILGNTEVQKSTIENSCITDFYAGSGYANFDSLQIKFKKDFEDKCKIPLDYIYTTKLFYGVFDLIKQSKFRPNSKILVVHSGGLQGNGGFEERYKFKLTQLNN